MLPTENAPAEFSEQLGRRWLFAFLAAAFFCVDLMLLEVASWFQDWARLPIASQWNWFGKSLSIALSCAVLAASPWLRRNVGLRWRQAPGSVGLSMGVFLAFLFGAIGIGFAMQPTAFSADTLLFQFVVPAVDEELIFRGILLAFGAILRAVAHELPLAVWICGARDLVGVWARACRSDRKPIVAVFAGHIFRCDSLGRHFGTRSHAIGQPRLPYRLPRRLGRDDFSRGNAAVNARDSCHDGTTNTTHGKQATHKSFWSGPKRLLTLECLFTNISLNLEIPGVCNGQAAISPR